MRLSRPAESAYNMTLQLGYNTHQWLCSSLLKIACGRRAHFLLYYRLSSKINDTSRPWRVLHAVPARDGYCIEAAAEHQFCKTDESIHIYLNEFTKFHELRFYCVPDPSNLTHGNYEAKRYFGFCTRLSVVFAFASVAVPTFLEKL